jgi:hypothetical protein
MAFETFKRIKEENPGSFFNRYFTGLSFIIVTFCSFTFYSIALHPTLRRFTYCAKRGIASYATEASFVTKPGR